MAKEFESFQTVTVTLHKNRVKNSNLLKFASFSRHPNICQLSIIFLRNWTQSWNKEQTSIKFQLQIYQTFSAQYVSPISSPQVIVRTANFLSSLPYEICPYTVPSIENYFHPFTEFLYFILKLSKNTLSYCEKLVALMSMLNLTTKITAYTM